MELRHKLKIHPVNPHNKSQWHEDGGNDREHLHYLVHTRVLCVDMNIHQAGSEVFIRIQ